MLNKKKHLIGVTLTGVILLIVGLSASIFLDKGELISRLFGLIFALGCGLIGGGIGGFCQIKRIEKIPGKFKQMEIEYNGELISRLFGLIFALGCGLIGGGIGGFCQIKRIEKIPGKFKQMEIEYNDERNTLIRYKANAKAGDISNWFVILIAYICIIMDYSTWLVFLLLGVFLMKYILWILLINKYNKEI